MSIHKFSLVVPVYKNEENISPLLKALSGIDRQLNNQLEVVFVVDGSPDLCYTILLNELSKQPFASQLILHSRNFGSFAAVRTGAKSMRGTYLAVMAADLQEPPELIVQIFTTLAADEADVVVGERDGRDDPMPSRLASNLYWWAYRKLIISEIPKGGVDIFGCSAPFLKELLNLEESHGSLIGLIYWLGFRRKTISYKRQARQHGGSAWTFNKKLNYLMDSVFSFSDLPIKLLISLGLVGLGFATGFGCLILGLKIAGTFIVPGYAATMLTILFFGSLNVIGIGIVGAYVWRSYGNTMNRPLAVVMKNHVFKNSHSKE